MAASKYVIWSNHDLDFDDWKDDLMAEYPDKSESELYDLMHEINATYLDDERRTLDIQLDETIIMIADVGRWNGRFPGYRIIRSGNIKDCLDISLDYATFYVDERGDLRCDAYHHDGVNHYLYRMYKNDASEARREVFENKILEGTATKQDVRRLTSRLGDAIGAVYGWPRFKGNIPVLQKER